jgi:hypothetical protein
VSVCIAIRHERKRLILITDNRVAFGDFSGENLSLKATSILYGYWQVMFAGNDVEHAEPIIRTVRRNLLATAAKNKRPHEAEEVAAIVDDAFSEQLQAQIENKILRKHGFDTESFQKSAKLKCPPEIYAKTWDRVDREKISLRFLVCGFDKEELPHIWLVDGENAPRSYNEIDFWAIGSGAPSALSRLALHVSKHQSFGTLEEAVYVGLTAKFAAEAASDVGPSTFVAICEFPHERDTLVWRNSLIMVSDDAIGRVRKIWDRTGIPPAPKPACRIISEDMAEMKKQIIKYSRQLRRRHKSKPSGSQM